MALTLPTKAAAPCTLEECLAAFDVSGFDPGCAVSLENAAHWLTRLAANSDFLADIALEELRNGCHRGGGQGYSPQVTMLGAPRPGWFMRANIWPSAQEAVVRESGEAAFVYGLPHDHNFSFMTVGYHGPGYRSDHYEVDPERLTGMVGEKVQLRFVESSVLNPGRVMLYRAGRDVHCQYPPDRLSVSINLMHSAPEQRWQDQYRYDLQAGTISGVLTRCTADTLARLSLALNADESRDMLAGAGCGHRMERMRWAAINALASEQPDTAARNDHLRRHVGLASGWLARRCIAAIAD